MTHNDISKLGCKIEPFSKNSTSLDKSVFCLKMPKNSGQVFKKTFQAHNSVT